MRTCLKLKAYIHIPARSELILSSVALDIEFFLLASFSRIVAVFFLLQGKTSQLFCGAYRIIFLLQPQIKGPQSLQGQKHPLRSAVINLPRVLLLDHVASTKDMTILLKMCSSVHQGDWHNCTWICRLMLMDLLSWC